MLFRRDATDWSCGLYDGDIPWITSGDLNKGYIVDVDGQISQLDLKVTAELVGADADPLATSALHGYQDYVRYQSSCRNYSSL